MNDQKKGIFTAVLATIVTSLMIYMTDISIAKSPDENTNNQALSVENNVSTEMAPESVNVSDIGNQLATELDTSNLLPPPGPFMHGGSGDRAGFSDGRTALEAPNAPQAPIGLEVINKTLSAPVMPDINMNAPQMMKAPAIISNQETNSSSQKLVQPTLEATQPSQPNAPVGARSNADSNEMVIKSSPDTPAEPQLNMPAPEKVLEAPEPIENNIEPPEPPMNSNQQAVVVNNDMPIWMHNNDQGTSNLAPQQNNQLYQQRREPNQMNMGSMLQYHYVPIPIYPSYYPQPQMPMNNAGYYRAPVPNFWMPPVMQGQDPGINQQPEQAPSEVPANKDSN